MSELENHGEASPSRRRMIKTGVAATGVAFVAPQILNTAVAGAATTTYYSFKLEGSCSAETDFNDSSSNGTQFNAAFAAAGSGLSGVQGCPPSGTYTITSGGIDSRDAVITAGTNCTILFAGMKSGQGFYWPGGGEDKDGGAPGDSAASVSISGDSKTATFFNTPTGSAGKDISHFVLIICCTGSPTDT